MKKFLLFSLAALMAGTVGCTREMRRPPDLRPPRNVDWQEPISVMRAFHYAKKSGDWRTAYRCCDYDETLPKEARARIKKKWREESRKWPAEYADAYWEITSRDFRDDTAVVRVHAFQRDPITRALRPGDIYEEKLKRYKDKWKITSFLPPETTE